MNKCLNCLLETPNPKYCSRSCAAIQNNKNYPKRQPTGQCKVCKTVINSKKKLCNQCKSTGKHHYQYPILTSKGHYQTWYKGIDLTLKDIIYNEHHKSSAYAKIRTRARAVAKSLGWKECCVCGYNKHIEISHRKPISSFAEDILVSVINDPQNLLPLCPNCHWEFDRKLINEIHFNPYQYMK